MLLDADKRVSKLYDLGSMPATVLMSRSMIVQEALAEQSTSKAVMRCTAGEGRAVDDSSVFGWLFSGSFFSCGDWETRDARVQRERDRLDPMMVRLLDNLHLLPSHQGAGIGRGLLTAVARGAHAHATRPGLYLWCYDKNTRARAFYEHLGAEAVEQIMYAAPDGQSHPEWRYAWRATPFAP